MDNQYNDDSDEVSLPGVGDNEQPTILEVLNRGIVSAEDEPIKGEQGIGDTLNTIKVTSTLEEELKTPKNDKESDNLVSSSSSSRAQAEWNEPQRSQLQKDEEKVLDFESHLIETLNNYSVSEDSDTWGVDIKELPPAEGEFLHTTSKIQTDPSIGTVFEVEPATPRVLKPVEISISEPHRQSGLAQKAQVEPTTPEPKTPEPTTPQPTTPEPSAQSQFAQKVEPLGEAAFEKIVDELETDDKKGGSSNRTETVESESGTRKTPESQVTDKPEVLIEPPVQVAETAEELEVECPIDDSKPIWTIVKELQSEFGENSIRSTDAKANVERRGSKVEFTGEEHHIAGKQVHGSEELKSEAQFDHNPEVEVTQSVDQADPTKVGSFIAQPETIEVSCNAEEIDDGAEKTTGDTGGVNAQSNESTSLTEKGAPKVELVAPEVSTPSEVAVDKPSDEILEKSNDKLPTEAAVGKPLDEVLQKSNDSLPEAGLDNPTYEVLEESNDSSESTDTTKTQIGPTISTETPEKSKQDIKTDLLAKELKDSTPDEKESASLTQEIDQKLSELATHLTSSSKVDLNGNVPNLKVHKVHLDSEDVELDVNGLPLPKTALEEEQRQQFLDSLPQISLETDSNKVAALAKREYYQSLRQYLITHSDKPPVPPETYRWEDLKRAKQRGGYPWTHLYKRPLGPDEEPEIVLLLRKSQELRFSSESPKSFKKVRIDDQVSIKETERYIQELSDNEEEHPTTEDEAEEEQEDARSECISCVSDSVLTVEKRASKLGKIRGILKKRSPKKEPDARSLPDTTTAPSTSLGLNHKSEEDIRERPSRQKKEPQNNAKCFPIMKKLKSMADRQKKNFRNIKKISLKKDEKISLEEEQKIIKLKTSPKAERSEIPHFIEKQDSDDVLEIVELDESPSRKRKDQLELQEQAAAAESTVLVPDEIIEIAKIVEENLSEKPLASEPTVPEVVEEEVKAAPPPKKTARLRREHVYEDIEGDTGDLVSEEINNILEQASVEALKQSLAMQDSSVLKDVEATKTALPLERMGSSEEELERSRLAPLSSIDSGSEDEKKPHLSPVSEESDIASNDGTAAEKEEEKLEPVPEVKKEAAEHIPWNDIELKPALKKEASPSPSDKKVTFSHVEDEAEPHREDIDLPEGLSGIGPKRWSNLR